MDHSNGPHYCPLWRCQVISISDYYLILLLLDISFYMSNYIGCLHSSKIYCLQAKTLV